MQMSEYDKKNIQGQNRLIEVHPDTSLSLLVVIPAYLEENLLDTLQSLNNCDLPTGSVEVIIIINEAKTSFPETSSANNEIYLRTLEWCRLYSKEKLKFYVFFMKLPDQDAGVGLARKIGMDESARRFEQINNSKNGIIVCFDADSLCDQNYLASIEQHFIQNPKSPGASIYFEHPLNENNYVHSVSSSYEPAIYEGIIKYELYLRYYINALRYAGHPYAFQTIGSSMAVRSHIYKAQGGMNKRKAGEDFYFLQKIIPLGDFTEINTTRVIPSPRPSDRVPFGTGRAINEWLSTGEYAVCDFKSFEDLKCFLASTDQLYESENFTAVLESYPETIRQFLVLYNFELKFKEIRSNVSNLISFKKRFFRWFDGFLVLKFIHFARDNFYPEIPVKEACDPFFFKIFNRNDFKDEKEMLLFLRETDRCSVYKN